MSIKRNGMKAIIISVVCLLTGCANSPIVISHMSPEELRSVDIKVLCHTHAAYTKNPGYFFQTKPRPPNKKIMAELLRRDTEGQNGGMPLFTDREWRLIGTHKVSVGMSENALICSWGLPDSCGGISHSSYGPTQYAYQSCEGYSSRFVYVEDGTVTDLSVFR